MHLFKKNIILKNSIKLDEFRKIFKEQKIHKLN